MSGKSRVGGFYSGKFSLVALGLGKTVGSYTSWSYPLVMFFRECCSMVRQELGKHY